MSDFPHPVGTYVLARHLDDDLPLRASCRNHIWEIKSEACELREGDFAMLVQTATCLVCGGAPTPPVTAEFFYRKADAFDVAGLFGEIAEAQEHLTHVKELLEAWWLNGGETPEKAPMRNFE